MTVAIYGSGTFSSVTGTESTLSSINVAGRFQLIVDTINMATGDVIELRAKQMVLSGGTARVTEYAGVYGAQPADEIIRRSDIINNELTDSGAVVFTLKHLFGTSRNFPWKVLNLDSGAAVTDPWTTSLPASYTPGQAGHILASRMPTGTVLVGDKTGFSLSSPQAFNLIGNISGTLTNVLNVINNVTGSSSASISSADMSTIASRVWDSTYSPIRTLTTSAGDSIPPAVGDDVFAIRGDTFIWDVSGLDLGNLSKIQFSVKKKFTDADSASLIFVETGTGLMWIDGVAGTPANGAITYSQPSGTARIRVEAVETAKLDVDQPLYYDIQVIRTTGTIVSSPLQGTFYITWDSTRSTS